MKAPLLRQACCDLEASLLSVERALSAHYHLCPWVAGLLELEGPAFSPKKRAAPARLAAAIDAFDTAPTSAAGAAAGNAAHEARWAAVAWDSAD
jgi:hypothetical protein